jgi:asparagine synthase (glutamine-hydrolysing)
MAGRLPEPILRQRKLGFNLPIAGWLAGELRDFAQDVLSPARLRRQGLLDPDAVGRLVTDHVRRRADHSRAIWALLFLTVWHDEVLRGSWAPAAGTVAPTAVTTERTT